MTISRRPPSGIARVLLRLPVGLHRRLAREAAAAGVSFNELCLRRLSLPPRADELSAAGARVVERANALLGDSLTGVVVLGSWARGEAAARSDIDVLIVIDSETPLTRDLYRDWDRTPLESGGRPVDAHFVHLPLPAGRPGAVWCEAAVDGVVWYDRDGRVARCLTDVRRAIAHGRVARAFAHGQPYWKGAA